MVCVCVCDNEKEKMERYVIARLDSKLANVLQDNKIAAFVINSGRRKSFSITQK